MVFDERLKEIKNYCQSGVTFFFFFLKWRRLTCGRVKEEAQG